MPEAARIADQLRRSHEGDAWHGPSLEELVSGVDARAAAARPVSGGHTIWEIVRHVAAWYDVVLRRLRGEPVVPVPDAQDWPPVSGASDASWSAAVADLKASRRRLEAEIAGLDDARLAEATAEPGYDVYVMLHGAVQHGLYHAGQIALLKRAAGR